MRNENTTTFQIPLALGRKLGRLKMWLFFVPVIQISESVLQRMVKGKVSNIILQLNHLVFPASHRHFKGTEFHNNCVDKFTTTLTHGRVDEITKNSMRLCVRRMFHYHIRLCVCVLRIEVHYHDFGHSRDRLLVDCSMVLILVMEWWTELLVAWLVANLLKVHDDGQI